MNDYTLIQNSVGGFHLQYLLNLGELLNLISSILPYMLHVYFPVRHLISRIRMPQVGCSVDLSNYYEESGITSDEIGSFLS